MKAPRNFLIAAVVFAVCLPVFPFVSKMPVMGGISAAAEKDYKIINAQEAKKMMDAGNVTVVDVRRPDEYASEHIPNAINIPVESIGAEKPQLLPHDNAVILVYCRTGIRAAAASEKLVKLGYKNIYDMGGITSWPYEKVK